MFFMALLSLLSMVALLPFAHTAHALPSGFSSAFELSQRGSPLEKNAFLSAHNAIRKLHGAKDLAWSAKLATSAERWADDCKFEGTNGVLSETPYGELQVAATGIFPIYTAIDQFVKDRFEYNPTNPTYNHWTQVVWKSTTHVGCARSQCNNLLGHSTGLATYYVCLYNPVGNVVGEALENVQL